MKNNNTRNFLIFLILSLLSTFIILFSWFKTGSIISNSEESLTIYNPSKTVKMNLTSWYPTEIGSYVPFGITRAYPFLLLSYLNKLSVPTFLIQAIFLGLIFLLTLICSYILFSYLSGGSFAVTFFASFFYLLNLYTQTQIFRRFLYNFMFALAYYPLFIFLWIKVLEKKDLKTLSLFLITSVFFSFSFNHPATILVFLASGGLIFLIRLWQFRKSSKEVLKLISISFIAGFLFLVVNFWWFYPLIKSGDYLSSITNSRDDDFKSLQAVSVYFPITDILLLRQSWWYGPSQHWFWFYKLPIVYLLSIIVLIAVFFGMKKSRSSQYWVILICLFIMGLFISKGTNPPFGEIFFKWLFRNFSVTSSLRNSYEKFGMVFLLPYALFFGVGLTALISKLKSHQRIIAYIISSLLFLVILVWPIWIGHVFLNSELYHIPPYYNQANTYLNQQNNLRIFHLPNTLTFAQKYDWGFYGQDPSEYLFDRDSISNSILEPLKTLFYSKLVKLSKDSDFPKLLGFLSVSNIVVHNEALNIPNDGLLDKDALKNWTNTNKTAQFGKLTIYNLDPEIIRSRFYTLSNSPQGKFPDKSILADTFVNLDYQALSPIFYQVKVNNSQKPFYLIFNDKFDSAWTATINSTAVQNHFLAYGLVNGWMINKTGSYIIKVKFRQFPWD